MRQWTAIIVQPVFWIALLASASGLSLAGIGAAWLLTPAPPNYYRTQFLELTLPPDWSCDKEGSETVCVPSAKGKAPAIIIFAAKVRGELTLDSLAAYERHLTEAKAWETPGGQAMLSRVVHVRRTRLGGREWVDSLHFESEVPGFYTRYLVTVTSHLGMVVTFSFLEDRYDEFVPIFEQCVADLITQQQV